FLKRYHCAVMLHGEQKLLLLLIHGYAKGSMRSVQLTIRTYIPLGLAGKDHYRIPRVVVHGVNIPIFRVNIDPALKLDLGLQSADGALRLGYGGRRAVIPASVDEGIRQGS